MLYVDGCKTLADLDEVLRDQLKREATRAVYDREIEMCAGPSGPRDGCDDGDGYGVRLCARHRYMHAPPVAPERPSFEAIASAVSRLAAKATR